MKKIWKPLLLIVIIGIIAAELFFDYRSLLDTSTQLASTIDLPVGTNSGELAPDFSGTTLDGEVVQLSDLRGKTVLVNIFASWCGPCRAEAPHLVEVDNLLGEDVVLLGLNLQENISAVESFKQDFGIDFPLVLNEDGKLTEIYKPIGLPTSWFIDPDGVVRYVHAGPLTSEIILAAIEDTQAGREYNPFGTVQ
jgi:thiol-disulfide isomerase/thioredoxin